MYRKGQDWLGTKRKGLKINYLAERKRTGGQWDGRERIGAKRSEKERLKD